MFFAADGNSIAPAGSHACTSYDSDAFGNLVLAEQTRIKVEKMLWLNAPQKRLVVMEQALCRLDQCFKCSSRLAQLLQALSDLGANHFAARSPKCFVANREYAFFMRRGPSE